MAGFAFSAGILLAFQANVSRVESAPLSPRVDALPMAAWSCSEWISAADAFVFNGAVKDGERAADGTSWFVWNHTNEDEVVSARWMTTALGVYDIYVNGRLVGEDFLKPGFTHNAKTKYSFTYDITACLKVNAGSVNVFSAEVSAGWWRDKICTPKNETGGFFGKKSAFRSVVELVFKNGTTKLYGTSHGEWRAGIAGPITHAAIFDGEEYDARQQVGNTPSQWFGAAESNVEFRGDILPTSGAEILLRWDLARDPVESYIWVGVSGADDVAFGRVIKTRAYEVGEKIVLMPGETLVVDFGQNAAAVPLFRFSAIAGTVLTALPAEMLNDGKGEKKRGNDGPGGSVYRANLREGHANGRLLRYTFAGKGVERYVPRFTYFGYRYLSMTATAMVVIETLKSVPVTSIRKDMEIGRLKTGSDDINRLVSNIYWGQLSNYLSIPTDCPQRNERLGWTADAQVFSEAASYNANVYDFFSKWMRDERDSQHANGGFPSVAPFSQYGNETMRIGWADAGVIVPYTTWKMFGDRRIVDENWFAMTRFLEHVEDTRYSFDAIRQDCRNGQYADWLSLEDYEPCNGNAYVWDSDGQRRPRLDAVEYWDFLGACYWLGDARMMAEMARATDRVTDVARWRNSAKRALAYARSRFVDSVDGMLIPKLRHLQGASLFALYHGILHDHNAVAATKTAYRKSIDTHGGCNMTGFLGTSILMDALTENGMVDIAYDLLFNRKFPGWLYSVDQGATTVWERWNSYTKEKGFGPAEMNSFNHYAYGAVLAWLYKTAAGISADPNAAGFRNIIMKPIPDRRLRFVTAEYASTAGLIKSAWRYNGEQWIWNFTVPVGATATVILPGDHSGKSYAPGSYQLTRVLK